MFLLFFSRYRVVWIADSMFKVKSSEAKGNREYERRVNISRSTYKIGHFKFLVGKQQLSFSKSFCNFFVFLLSREFYVRIGFNTS